MPVCNDDHKRYLGVNRVVVIALLVIRVGGQCPENEKLGKTKLVVQRSLRRVSRRQNSQKTSTEQDLANENIEI